MGTPRERRSCGPKAVERWGVERMTNREIRLKSDRGFTLTELMVSLVISGVLMTAVYAVFNSQQKSYAVQDQLPPRTRI